MLILSEGLRRKAYRLYYYNDPKAVVIETGLNYWEACKRCNQLNKESSEPIGRYKPCHEKNWTQQIKFHIENR